MDIIINATNVYIYNNSPFVKLHKRAATHKEIFDEILFKFKYDDFNKKDTSTLIRHLYDNCLEYQLDKSFFTVHNGTPYVREAHIKDVMHFLDGNRDILFNVKTSR